MREAVLEVVAAAPDHPPAWDIAVLKNIERRLLWLSTLMIHHANNVRPNPDKTKVGSTRPAQPPR
jgi:pyruvate dehydrogenase E1 component